jgi:hypothetical protein
MTHLAAHVPHFLLQASIGFEHKLVYCCCSFAVVYGDKQALLCFQPFVLLLK